MAHLSARGDDASGALTPPGSWARRIDAATPATRDRYADLLRVLALAVVVLGHWTLVLVVLDGTDVFADDLAAQAATWVLMVMPVFFVVGGFAHATSLRSRRAAGVDDGVAGYVGFVRSRVARLLQPVLAYLAVWLVVAVALDALGAVSGPIDTALDRVPTVLWFVAVYLVVVLAAPPMLTAHERFGGWVVAVLVAAVAALDVLRFVGGADWTAAATLLLVWLTVHQLGFLWADGALTRPGAAAVLTVAGLGTALVLTAVTGWYPLDMLGLPGSATSNFAPPTLALLAHAAGFSGALLLLRRPVARWLQRPRAWAPVVVAGSVVLTVYCWHLSAAFVVQGLFLLAGVGWPAAPSTAWWLLLPLWWALCLPVLVLLVVATRRWERPRPALVVVPPGRWSAVTTTLGAILAGAGLLVLSQVGLDGILAGEVETVFGVPLTAWAGLLLLAVGVALDARRPWRGRDTPSPAATGGRPAAGA